MTTQSTAVHVTEEQAKPFSSAHAGGNLGSSGLQTLVHKQGHEASIMIDPLIGAILTPTDERPEWAEHYSTAMVAQRMRYYSEAVGAENIPNSFKLPEIMAAEDLDWLCNREYGHDENGNQLYYTNPDGSKDPFEAWVEDADQEFRSEVVAVLSGLKKLDETDLSPEMFDFTGLTSVDLAIVQDDQRTEEEMQAFEDAQKEGFAATGTDQK